MRTYDIEISWGESVALKVEAPDDYTPDQVQDLVADYESEIKDAAIWGEKGFELWGDKKPIGKAFDVDGLGPEMDEISVREVTP